MCAKYIKLFWREGCPSCPEAKAVCEELAKYNIKVEYYNVDTEDGTAEARFHGVISIPTLILVDESENELASWRGETPTVDEVRKLLFSEQ